MIYALLVGLFAISLIGGYWVMAVIVTALVAYRYTLWPLFLVAVLVDGYYGAFSAVPVASLYTGALVLLSEVFTMYVRKSKGYE